MPLKEGDAGVGLDLQAVFSTIFDRVRYNLTLNYELALQPPLSDAEAEWFTGLREANKRTS